MSNMDPRKMRVTELRAELQRRGLESCGLKTELCERLQEALDSELLGVEEDDGEDCAYSAMGGGQEEDDESVLALAAGEEEDEETMEVEGEEDEDELDQAGGDKSPQNKPPPSSSLPQTATPELRDLPPVECDTRDLGNKAAAVSEELKDLLSEKDMDESEEAATVDSLIREAKKVGEGGSNAGVKRLQEEEQGQTYHEFNEEACFSRSNSPLPAEDPLDNVEECAVCLDISSSDLHFRMDKDRYGGHPLFFTKFPSLWSGSRTSHGVTAGKVYFEIKRTLNLPLKEGCTEVPLLRVGWSIGYSRPQFGEDGLSFVYDSRGLKVTKAHFEDYGESFGENDVIGCYADLEGDSVKLSFSKNGVDLGQAFLLKMKSLGGQALFPHILCKGCAFQANFGQREKPWHEPCDGFNFLQACQAKNLIRAQLAPKSTEECEVLLMVGLPGAGKTTWVQKHIEKNPDKHYVHLCIDRLLPQLKTIGPNTLEKNSKTRNDLIKMATQCLIRLVPIASRREGNYIIDQCTVYRSAQYRKMKCFEGFKRKAVVLVSEEDEWKRRLEIRKREGEIYPETVLQQMKAHFDLPKKCDCLDEIICPELGIQKAIAVTLKAKKEARSLPEKRQNCAVKPQLQSLVPKQLRTRAGLSKRMYPRPHSYHRPPMIMPHWRPQVRDFQNYYDPYQPQQNRQNRYFGPQNHGLQNHGPQNRGHWQNSNNRTQNWNYYGYP
ncbi:heterogeneous nuclear ribonucleoprotein U-like protein 2 [Pelobates fuscus]|uniref:heterogeneous nuclear ribonucleoprotein U-like protein 2 n=1 Tax=Pelobates fuscus TaxID=191477 RepID=UPI002FE4C548